MRQLILSITCLSVSLACWGQSSSVSDWKPSNQTVRNQVYHPEPILFIHGINNNDKDWGEDAIPSLKDAFTLYDLPNSARSQVGKIEGFNAQQEAYLHTFNYGDPPDKSTHNSNSFDHIEWNAWAADRNSSNFVNIFNGQSQPHPTDQRETLDERIKGKGANGIGGIRYAYRADANDPNNKPNIVLVAHSMGGLLSHYYLCKSYEASETGDTGVRRLVTLGSPHQGGVCARLRIRRLTPT